MIQERKKKKKGLRGGTSPLRLRPRDLQISNPVAPLSVFLLLLIPAGSRPLFGRSHRPLRRMRMRMRRQGRRSKTRPRRRVCERMMIESRDSTTDTSGMSHVDVECEAWVLTSSGSSSIIITSAAENWFAFLALLLLLVFLLLLTLLLQLALTLTHDLSLAGVSQGRMDFRWAQRVWVLCCVLVMRYVGDKAAAGSSRK